MRRRNDGKELTMRKPKRVRGRSWRRIPMIDLRAKLTAEVERLRQHARYLQNAERALLDDVATRLEAIVKGEPHAH